MMSLLKNPIVLGIITICLIYVYYWYTNKKEKEKINNMYSRNSINYQTANQQLMMLDHIPLWKPIIGGIIVFFLSQWYFSKGSSFDCDLSNMSEEVTIEILPISGSVNMDVWK